MTRVNATAAEIRAALKRRFPAPECSIVFEVAQSTGHAANRRLDAIVMELWPSRGLALHGIEIKANYYDWRREKAMPEKAEQIARFCDFFWVAAPAGLIPIEEVPSAWGLLELNGDGDIRTVRAAAKTDAEPVTRRFLAAMMRAATRVEADMLDGMVARHRKALDDDFEKRVQSRAEIIAMRADDDAKVWCELVAALGEDPKNFHENADLIKAVRVVWKSGVAQSYGGLKSLYQLTAKQMDGLRSIAADLDIDVQEQDPPVPRKRVSTP